MLSQGGQLQGCERLEPDVHQAKGIRLSATSRGSMRSRLHHIELRLIVKGTRGASIKKTALDWSRHPSAGKMERNKVLVGATRAFDELPSRFY